MSRDVNQDVNMNTWLVVSSISSESLSETGSRSQTQAGAG